MGKGLLIVIHYFNEVHPKNDVDEYDGGKAYLNCNKI